MFLSRSRFDILRWSRFPKLWSEYGVINPSTKSYKSQEASEAIWNVFPSTFHRAEKRTCTMEGASKATSGRPKGVPEASIRAAILCLGATLMGSKERPGPWWWDAKSYFPLGKTKQNEENVPIKYLSETTAFEWDILILWNIGHLFCAEALVPNTSKTLDIARPWPFFQRPPSLKAEIVLRRDAAIYLYLRNETKLFH